ncbi:DUF4238 domain-containing protein [Devosia rhizoryzae]|uniref:DUF4238 domain-containing protein n=1 Tax=Devosia rhizoryzae TaxID=2774137 RepID=A0ABX7C4N3_9HYPH|nr:DUF4238 domain-containing protein [Devosia rhizoryzae]QQR39202.1 DUF4238 domain-containing protein [Devosia rhizoryzae]
MGRKRRHHFVPRLMLNRFASRSYPERKVYLTWMYSLNQEPIEVSTKDTGLEKDFHGENDHLEDMFMQVEGNDAALLRRAHEDGADLLSISGALADLAWVMAFRTKTLREHLTTAVQSGLSEMSRQATSEDAAAYYRRQIETTLQERFGELLNSLPEHEREAFKLSPQFKIVRQQAAQMAEALISSGVMGQFVSEGFSFVSKQAEETTVVRSSHNDGLEKLLLSEKRCPENRKPDKWLVVESAKGEFVLGDSVVFATDREGVPRSLVGASADTTDIYLPISPSKVLVGLMPGVEQPALKAAQIVDLAVSTSRQSFFANCFSPHLVELHRLRLGRDAHLMDTDLIKAAVAGVWSRNLSAGRTE